jgi:hypothetical protein
MAEKWCKVVTALSGLGADSAFAGTQMSDREMIRAIMAVQMSAGDNDGSTSTA